MPTKLERCVKAVRKKGRVRSPYAVCKASIMKKRKRKQAPTLDSDVKYLIKKIKKIL